MIEFKVDKPQKLSALCKEKAPLLSYSALMKVLRKKDVKVNGRRVSSNVTLAIGDDVRIYVGQIKPEFYLVVYQDENILVVDKKRGFNSESVFEDLVNKFGEVYFIHRLDTNTAGIMIFARNKKSEETLLAGFKNRDFDKRYLCEVFGEIKEKTQTLNAYLLKDATTSTVKIFDYPVKGAVEIKTGYTLLKQNADTALLEVRLYTGKTHQIRAHLAHVGHFIVGDGKYGENAFNRAKGAKRQRLVAYKLTLKFDSGSPLYYLNDKTFFSGCEL